MLKFGLVTYELGYISLKPILYDDINHLVCKKNIPLSCSDMLNIFVMFVLISETIQLYNELRIIVDE